VSKINNTMEKNGNLKVSSRSSGCNGVRRRDNPQVCSHDPVSKLGHFKGHLDVDVTHVARGDVLLVENERSTLLPHPGNKELALKITINQKKGTSESTWSSSRSFLHQWYHRRAEGQQARSGWEECSVPSGERNKNKKC
jgi:hypothetical protein